MSERISNKEVGDKFELKSLEIIEDLIKTKQISQPKEQLKIFRQKGYFSNLRKKNITFDLTIEVWPPEATRYSFLYVIECKKYKNRVPVNRVETFHSQLAQLDAFNIKAIFISNAPFQQGAYNLAEQAGFLVVQGESSEDYRIILHKTNRASGSAEIPLLKKEGNRKLTPSSSVKELDSDILSLFRDLPSKDYVSYGINKLSKKEISVSAGNELNKIDKNILSIGYSLNVEKLSRYLESEYNIKIKYFFDSSETLGYCENESQKIGINKKIKGTKRELFILAHELGHFILHQKLKIGQNEYNNFEDSQYDFQVNKHDLKNPRNWIEWQANYFASSLILPEKPFRARLIWCQERQGLLVGKVYFSDNATHKKDFYTLIKRMAYLFNTTQTSIIYRLKEFQLINNQSRVKTIGQIFSELIDD